MGKLVALILESKPHPEQGFRACLGILRLARQYGRDRLEAACDRGLAIGARSYGSIHSILQTGASQGMALLDNSIRELVQKGVVKAEEAARYVEDAKVAAA